MLTKREVNRNMQDVDYAIAQQRLEGLTVSAATTEDMKQYARGEISIAECIERVKKRHTNVGKILKS